MDPYYSDEWTTLYLGDAREVVPGLGLEADLVIADPPYGDTAAEWDRWPDGWPAAVARTAPQMWCFGSMRMFMTRLGEFAAWTYAQEVVWEKNTGSGFQADRFRRIHEFVVHWYRGAWTALYLDPQREPATGPYKGTVRHHAATSRGEHVNSIRAGSWVDDGTRMMTSVVHAANLQGKGIPNPTAKPVPVLAPLIAYSCPPGGLVVDAFSGSGQVLLAARSSGRRAVGVEVRESQCEAAARRLQQGVLLDAEPVPAVPSPLPSFPETPLFDVS